MLPIKKIICPTDFSEPSFEAVKVAGELATHFGSFLCLLHVVSITPVLASPMMPTAFNVNAYQKALEDDAIDKLRKVREDLVPVELHTCSPRVVSGFAPDEIINMAVQEQADLIVIATHGLTGWRHLIYGSVAERVVQLAPCAVLAIRPPNIKLRPGDLKQAVTEVKKLG
jgi:nucleotide-binding universal stress UspA family protein